MMKTGFV